jgi:dienelactone hydrolase
MIGLHVEHLSIETERGEFCPVYLVRRESDIDKRLRPVIYMHGTNSSKHALLKSGHLQRVARMGLLAVGVDSRHHGERPKLSPGGDYSTALQTAYRRRAEPTTHGLPVRTAPRAYTLGAVSVGATAACLAAAAYLTQRRPSPIVTTASLVGALAFADWLTRATREVSTPVVEKPQYAHPFILDTVWDLMRLLDYLESRNDVDCSRVGATGISLGGMHSWLWAAADGRVSVTAPAIGVQHFGWALEHDAWHARAASLGPLFDAAVHDLRRPLDAHVVRKVWEKLLPDLHESYDAPLSLAAIAPRPCLIVNNAADPRCPRAGLEVACREAWQAAPVHNLGLLLDTSIAARPLTPAEWKAGHTITPAMQDAIDATLRHCVLDGHDRLPPGLASLPGVELTSGLR